MALPALDSFNRADGGLGSNWTDQGADSALTIISNQVHSGGAYAFAFWNADTFAADQYSQCVCVTGNSFSGPSVRASGTGGSRSAYFLDSSVAGTTIRKQVAAAETVLKTIANPAVNDVVRLEVSGSTLTIKYNGTTIDTTTDASLTSGSAGIVCYNGGTSERVDDWEGGNLGTVPTGRFRRIGFDGGMSNLTGGF